MLTQEPLPRRQLVNLNRRRIPRVHLNRPRLTVAQHVINSEPTHAVPPPQPPRRPACAAWPPASHRLATDRCSLDKQRASPATPQQLLRHSDKACSCSVPDIKSGEARTIDPLLEITTSRSFVISGVSGRISRPPPERSGFTSQLPSRGSPCGSRRTAGTGNALLVQQTPQPEPDHARSEASRHSPPTAGGDA